MKVVSRKKSIQTSVITRAQKIREYHGVICGMRGKFQIHEVKPFVNLFLYINSNQEPMACFKWKWEGDMIIFVYRIKTI